MEEFPKFMRRPCNAVKVEKRSGEMEGYVFDGLDESQMVIWHSRNGGRSEMHVHDFDEYCLVIQGIFKGAVGAKRLP